MELDLGMKIRDIRINKNMTQKEVAHKICSEMHLHRLENGKSLPSYFILKSVLVKHNCNIKC